MKMAGGDFSKAFRLSLPIWAAFWFLGMSYGLLSSSMGCPVWVTLLHLWKRNMFLTIAGGTIVYMVLLQTEFAG